MESRKKSLAEPIHLGVIANQRSYWATHFYSTLQCLESHKNLMHSPRTLPSFPDWSLSHMRGQFPINFFDSIEHYIKNWGVQYFLANFFNQKVGGHIVLELVSRLEKLYNTNLSRDLNKFSCHVSGQDSEVSAALRGQFSKIFPDQLNGVRPDVRTLINYSDLCLILTDERCGINVGIFGEVEGIYGNKFRNERYWDKKQDFCVFGIGVVDGSNGSVHFQELVFDGISKVILLFERSNYVVKDFHLTLNNIKQLFLYGPTAQLNPVDEEFDFFIDMLKRSWSDPITILMRELSSFIDIEDLVGRNDNEIEIITS
ncbi:MAG: hypothetical protein LZF64_02325, partial [Nitrosomonas sp.]